MSNRSDRLLIALADNPGVSLGALTDVLGPDDPPEAGKWTEWTAFIQDVDFTIGSSTMLGVAEAGTLNATLLNLDNRFDAANPDGPYYGLINPRKRVQYRVTHDGVERAYWTGFLQDLRPEYTAAGMMSVAKLTATDLYETQRQDAFGAAYQKQIDNLEPVGNWRFDEEFGSVAIDSAPPPQGGSPFNGGYPSDAVRGSAPIIKEGKSVRTSVGDDVTITWAAGNRFDYARDWTLVFFVEFSALAAFSQIVYWGRGSLVAPGTSHFLSAELQPAGDLVLTWQIVGSASTNYVTLTDTEAAAGAGKYMIVARLEGYQMSLWLNGDLVAGPSQGPVPATSANGMTTFLYMNALAPSYIGADEMALFDRALTADEISNLYIASTELRAFTGDLSTDRIVAICDLAKIPGEGLRQSDDRDIDTGGVEMMDDSPEDKTLLEYAETVRHTEGGLYYAARDGKVTFRTRHHRALSPTVGAAITPDMYYEIETARDYDAVYSHAEGNRRGANKLRLESADAFDINGELVFGGKTYSYGETLHKTDNLLRDLLAGILLRFGEPQTVPRSLILRPGDAGSPTRSEDIWTEIHEREIFTRAQVDFVPQRSSYSVSSEVFVDRISYRCGAARTLADAEVTYELSPAPVGWDFWELGITDASELGEQTVLAL